MRILEWIKKHRLATLLICVLIFVLPLVIVHILFKWKTGNEWLWAEWSAGDVLAYVAGFEAFIGTTMLGLVTVYQSKKATEASERLSEENNFLQKISIQKSLPLVRVTSTEVQNSGTTTRRYQNEKSAVVEVADRVTAQKRETHIRTYLPKLENQIDRYHKIANLTLENISDSAISQISMDCIEFSGFKFKTESVPQVCCIGRENAKYISWLLLPGESLTIIVDIFFDNPLYKNFWEYEDTFDEKYKAGLLAGVDKAYETRRLFLKEKCKTFSLEKEIRDMDFDGLGEREVLIKMENVLHPEKVDGNRDISVRYYAIAILRKAIYDGVLDSADATAYLPPYHAENNQIALCKEALAGTRMGGYGIIDYDLSRYVLIDHLDSRFTSYRGVAKGQIDKLIKAIAAEQPGYEGMSMPQFVLSAAYAYLLNSGWNNADFCNHTYNEAGENVVEGVDVSIKRTHSSATHGSKSSVMTVAEKYVWQARNEISGFFCDRLLYGDDAEEITDYGMLDDFVVPAHELTVIDPNNIPEDKPWHIPNPSSAILDGYNESREDVANNVLHAPVVPWDQWICVGNSEGKYKVSSKNLYMLHMYSCFYGSAGVETNIFLDAIIVKSSDVETFVEMLVDKGKENDRLANPTDWYGGIDASCYITPKEICCFPWKTGYSSSNVEEFSDVDISCAVDECCCNIEEYGDVFYYLPSAELRKKLGIADTDGYLYTDTESKVVAEYTLAGEKWRTYQSCLLLDRNLAAEQLSKDGKSLVWIMRERRSSSGLTSEKYGKFGADRFKSYVGYFKGESFEMREISSSFQSYLPIIK